MSSDDKYLIEEMSAHKRKEKYDKVTNDMKEGLLQFIVLGGLVLLMAILGALK